MRAGQLLQASGQIKTLSGEMWADVVARVLAGKGEVGEAAFCAIAPRACRCSAVLLHHT